MNNAVENDEEQFKPYTPQHPLPEEIKKLAKDDTVCKYCGVSYLIHNEIKKLEEKLLAAEKELAQLRGQEQREHLLKQECDVLKQQKQELQHTIETNCNLKSSLNAEVKQLKETNDECQNSLSHYKNKYMSTLRQLSKLSQTVRQQKNTLQDLRLTVNSNRDDLVNCFKSIQKDMTNIKDTSTKEVGGLESRLQCVEMEKLVLTQSNKSLTDNLKQREDELKLKEDELRDQRVKHTNLEGNLLDAMKLEEELKNTRMSLKDAEQDLERSTSKCSTLSLEIEQFKAQLKSKNSEFQELAQTLKQIEQGHEIAVQKLYLELQAKEGELATSVKQLKSLTNQFREQQKKENQFAEEKKLNQNEAEHLKENLLRAKGDVEALKAERELMIQAHQNRIEDLRESFKNKMAEMENWPQKLQAAVVAEKTRHIAEIKTLEDNLKHNFVMELQIEKDKYNELLKKFQDQEKNKSSMRDHQLNLMEQKYKQEMEFFKRQVSESKSQLEERETELNKEIASLKKIISDLQDRLAKLDDTDNGKVLELKQNLAEVHQELSNAQHEIESMEGQLRETKEEAQFLQGVVRKECEERFELTEALSEARKELLQLKKPAGGYNQKRGSITSLQPSNMSAPGSPAITSDDPVLKLRSKMPTNNVNLSYSNNSSRSNSGNDKNKDTQILESRKRIAQMLGRR